MSRYVERCNVTVRGLSAALSLVAVAGGWSQPAAAQPDHGCTQESSSCQVPPDGDAPDPPPEPPPQRREAHESHLDFITPSPIVIATETLDQGLSIESDDERFRIRVGGILSLRAVGSLPTGETGRVSFETRLVRLNMGGHAFGPWLRYFMQVGFAGPSGVRLLDAEMSLAPAPAFRLRVGQYRTPYSRQFMTPIGELALPSRSVVSDRFRANRDTGALVQGRLLEGRLEYYAGVFDGNGVNHGGNDNPAMLWLGRLVVSPLGETVYDEIPALHGEVPPQLSLGVAGYHVRVHREETAVEPTTGQMGTRALPDERRTTAGVDLWFAAGPVTFTAEGHLQWREADDLGAWREGGAFAQLGVMLVPGILDTAVRFDWLATDVDDPAHALLRGELGLNWYVLANHLKLQVSYRYDAVPDGAENLPVAGEGHTITVQSQLAL